MRIYSENHTIAGPAGQLEAVVDLNYPASKDELINESQNKISSNFMAICCHPHPLHGGTMTNKVIHTASRAIAGLGIPSVRFNFRGVGASEGQHADGVGEQQDLLAVISWCEKQFPDRKLMLCGFSFGAYISAMVSSQKSIAALLSIAAPVGRIDFQGVERPNSEWIVIQGKEDELVDYQLVKEWTNSFKYSPEFILLPETSHFFHGKLVNLREIIESFINRLLAN